MFCPKCGSIAINKKNKLVCINCGEEIKSSKIKESAKENEKSFGAIEEEPEIHPKTDETCPKCGNNEAYYWSVQTRAADESPTRFYKCTKCSHVWREYS